MADPQKDEHIEELLSKLQGIFGKLSHFEEGPKRNVEPPLPAPAEPDPAESAPPEPVLETPAPPPIPVVPAPEEPEPPGLPEPVAEAPAPPPTPAAPEPEKPEPPAPPEPVQEASAPPPIPVVPEPEKPEPPAPPPTPVAPEPEKPKPPAPAPASAYETSVPQEDPEKLIVPSAIYYPPGKEAQAKSLAQKLETMTPKFTKVAFRLRVGVFMPYDPRSDWKETIHTKAAEAKFQTVFVVIDRPLEDAKRKLIVATLEAAGVYFQDVLVSVIEKKAFYTDVLLGLVFFFDSRKPSGDAQESTS